MGLALILCSCATPGKQSQQGASGKTSADRDSGQVVSSVQESAENGPSEASSRIQITSAGDKAVIYVPVSDDVQVSPDYTYPELRLGFAPPAKRMSLAEAGDHPLIKDMRFTKAKDPSRVETLRISLERRIQFLISRMEGNKVKVMLTAAPGKKEPASAESGPKSAEGRESASTAAAENGARLTGVDFTKDSQGKFRIKLRASSAFDYQPRPTNKDKVKFVFPGMSVPKAYEKLYNLKKFSSPVTSALLHNSAEGAALSVNLRQRVPFNIDRRGGRLELAFHKAAPAKNSEAGTPDKRPQARMKEAAQEHNATNQDTASALESRGGEQNGTDSLFPGMKKDYTGKRISLDLQEADVKHVLRLLANISGNNLVMSDQVQGQITLKLDDVPWDQALDIVLQQMNLEVVQQGNIMRIMTAQQYQQEQQRKLERIQARKEAQQSRKELEPLQTEYIQVNYSKAGQMQSQIQQFLSDRGQVSVDQRTNQLIVSDTSENIDKVRSVVRKLDRPERQVLIQARFVSATDQFQRSMGVRWGGEYRDTGGTTDSGVFGTAGQVVNSPNPTPSGFAVNLPNPGSTTLGVGTFLSQALANSIFSLDAQLSLGETKGLVKTISSPKVVTLNNQQAQITQGTKIATKTESESGGTTTEYVEATLSLTVTPQITPDDKLILDLQITDDSPVAGGEDIETRSANTKLIVDDKETIVLGGVHELTETNNQNSVPGVSRVPLLGWLFKNKQRRMDKRELLIFIQPKILQ
jgi:type IV pilus assembly protein PilQ